MYFLHEKTFRDALNDFKVRVIEIELSINGTLIRISLVPPRAENCERKQIPPKAFLNQSWHDYVTHKN